MYIEKEEQRVGQLEQDEWVKVTAEAYTYWDRSDPPLCPWHVAFLRAGLPINDRNCGVDSDAVSWADGRVSYLPWLMREWISKNDYGRNPPPMSVLVNRRTLTIRYTEPGR